jgi:hypothetical protein
MFARVCRGMLYANMFPRLPSGQGRGETSGLSYLVFQFQASTWWKVASGSKTRFQMLAHGIRIGFQMVASAQHQISNASALWQDRISNASTWWQDSI